MSAFASLPVDPVTGAVGRRASGAPLYHRGSRFGAPEKRKLDRNMRVRILHLAIALDRRTRAPGQHGGVFKRTGIAVLRTLLFQFLNMKTGACYPSLEQIARAAGCCAETVRRAIRALEAAGIITTVRRVCVASFTSRVHRVQFDVAVQCSNSYMFNVPIGDRPEHGDLALPLLKPERNRRAKADAKFRRETPLQIKKSIRRLPADPRGETETELAVQKARWLAALLGE